MKSLVLAALLLVAGAPTAVASPVSPYIIGGEPVESARWAVGLYWDDNRFGCSGSIIAPRWVLTATHCGVPDFVRLGDVNLGEGTRADVVRGHQAPEGDVTLLELASDVDAEYVQLASEDPQVGESHHIYGWGTYEVGEGKPASPFLKRAAVEVIGTAEDAFGGPAIETTWTTGTAGYGDSGGPQINADGVQVGVCSTGDYVKTQYGSIAHHREWIRSVSGV